MSAEDLKPREARHDDYESVVSFTRDTWSERGIDDYIPRVYHDWIDDDGDKHTLVMADGDEIGAIAQCVLLSEHEAWGQGLRVNPKYRGEGVSERITHALFDWAYENGARVMRNMVFSWNVAGLGQSRKVGYEPITEFRWAKPEPDPNADPELDVVEDPASAWSYWVKTDARDHLKGLTLDMDESWAMSELTLNDLKRASDETKVLAVQKRGGTSGMAYRAREFEREAENEGDNGDSQVRETERWVEYGVGVWDGADSARSLLGAISKDAADMGADKARVLIPESVRYVSDTALARVNFSEEPDFVLGADLTDDYRS
ncbi:MAG: GNAT family N-acetyltransferase [Halobacteria archaeon]|nr:GNAT family N-acetyltransferase [Halobacteria archaeon]